MYRETGLRVGATYDFQESTLESPRRMEYKTRRDNLSWVHTLKYAWFIPLLFAQIYILL